MPTVLITGANRGIGLEFARQYSENGWTVMATARHSSPELDALGVRVAPLELGDLDSVAAFGAQIDAPLDLLIANAGTYGPKEAVDAGAAREWGDTLAVNAIAPYLLARSVLPMIEKARGKLIAISSKMGSIDDNSSGGYLAYRTSKTALNSAWRNLAIYVRGSGVVAAVLHPGWVKTRMGGGSAPLQPEKSVSGMRRVIRGLGPDASGGFFSYDGSTIAW
jgi:NAD(P)-dependent dehydrogenase (short-subunit alcohol dehydrogenase family)